MSHCFIYIVVVGMCSSRMFVVVVLYICYIHYSNLTSSFQKTTTTTTLAGIHLYNRKVVMISSTISYNYYNVHQRTVKQNLTVVNYYVTTTTMLLLLLLLVIQLSDNSVRHTVVVGVYSFGIIIPPPTKTRTLLLYPLYSSRTQELTRNLRDLQSSLLPSNEDDDASLIIQALRGRNLNDDDTAVDGLQMKLVTIQKKDTTTASSSSSSTATTTTFDPETGLPYVYNPQLLKEFFRGRPILVLTRILQLMNVGGSYVLTLFLDQIFQRHVNNPNLEIVRATQLRNILTSLGPFYIKIGQALSIRPDILSPRSMVELQKLCDKVPSYDTSIAFDMFQSEMYGKSVYEIFSNITSEPVAAASLGQVYKATLRDSGDVVAVKIQRPGVLETVSLDLYLAREFGIFIRNIPTLTQRFDPVALLDEFAYRFYQELDYNLECLNGIRIANDMKVLPMVVIPKNYPQYTTRRVHVAEWIEGEKLSQSTADDVSSLVNLGVITYMTMLLGGAKEDGSGGGGGSGFFHADPHPGNMLRTTDGKLAILDFGLMTEITDDQKYGMIEAIAHLINRDYQEIGQDFINLDFIPKGTDTRPIVPALTKVFDVALAGGGAKSINFQELAADLAQITFDYPFRIPPYFALVIRAISVLEGIALVGNPNFAIIDEAYPYIARRLMTDRSPRLQAALRYMIYGRDGIFDAENAIDLLQALEKFKSVRDDGDGTSYKVNGVRGTKVVGSAGDFRGSQVVDTSDRDTSSRFRISNGSNMVQSQQSQSTTTTTTSITQTQNDQRTVREALRFFFSPEGTVFREFMLEEIVNVLDASGRGAIQELTRTLGLNNFPLPGFVRAFNPEITEKDRMIIQQIRILFNFLMGDYSDTSITSSARLRQLLPVAREYATQLRDFGLLLGVRLTEKNLSRGMNWATDQLAQQQSRSRFASTTSSSSTSSSTLSSPSQPLTTSRI